MRIDDIRTYRVSKPLKTKLPNSVYVIERMEHVLVEIEAEGYVGIGYVYSINAAHADALEVYIKDHASRMIGKDSDMIRDHLRIANIINSPSGPDGTPTCAYAALDMALWDLLAQKAKMPLYVMLGGRRKEVPVYASGGWLIPEDDLVAEAYNYKCQGYKVYKMKLGCKDFHEDLHRIKAIQEKCGPEFEIMVDVNQGWSAKKAVMIAPYLKELGITYLEEPVLAQGIRAHQILRDKSDINICAGESLSYITELFELIRHDCVDMLNPDMMKCGGVTNYLQVCLLADAYQIPVTSHIFTEFSAHVLAAIPNGTIVEYIPDWWDGIFDHRPNIKDGMILMDDTPGVGYKFDHDFIKDHLAKH